MKWPVVSRRTMLLSGAAALGGGYALLAPPESYLAALLRHLLPGEAFEAGAVESFVGDYLARASPGTRRNVRILAVAARGIGASGLDAVMGDRPGYDWLKRTMVTQFMLNSDFFARAQPQPIAYFGFSPICANPYARFNDA